MSTDVATRSSKAAEDAARKRKRRAVIGASVGAGVGLGLFAWWWSKRGDVADGDANTQPELDPIDGRTPGSRDPEPTGPTPTGPTPVGPSGTDPLGPEGSTPGGGSRGGGASKGGANKGGGRGPGGTVPGEDDPQRVSPLGGTNNGGGQTPSGTSSPRRTNPKRVSPRRTNPKGNTTPKGPNPKIRDLDAYYNADWPDPGKFYQVGRQDADGFYGITWRWFYTCLFLAAKNAGGLDDDAAREWAAARVGPKGAAQAERADFLLCAAWNDVTYGSNAVAAKNRRGPHGRGIDLVPQHADNWRRIGQRKKVRRNVYMETPGTVATPRNAGKGDAKLPLLWMPRLSDQVLWDSEGRELQAAGSWADGSSFYFPPPVVMNLGIDDATSSATASVWGCGEGEGHYG